MQDRHTPRRPEPLIDLSAPLRCHFVGVGGPGMSPIALLMARRGHRVSGSDTRASAVTDQLRSAGVTVHHEHSPEHVKGVDLVVYSTAIRPDHVELVAAVEEGVAVRHRSGMLASLCAVTRAVGVAGTHGKTTTTALLAHVLDAAGLDASAIIGAEVSGTGIGAVVGGGDLLVLEADESDGTLDVLGLHAMVLTNIDKDHLDYFGSMEAAQRCFAAAVARCEGPVVLNGDDPGSAGVVATTLHQERVTRFGSDESAEVRIVSAHAVPEGTAFTLEVSGRSVRSTMPLRGVHNVHNAAAAIAMAWRLGADPEVAAGSLAQFAGVARRFTERGLHHGALLIDDYAHLPAEISAALSAARSHPARSGRLIAVFQPNRFHRIAAMADDYANCFVQADLVVITEIYASGTEPIPGVSGRMVADAIVRAHPGAAVVWAPSRADVVGAVAAGLAPGDLCISMGCGDIESFPDDLREMAP